MADRRGPNLNERLIQSATSLWASNSEPLILIRELLSTALIVAIVGLVLFAVSGLWPPLVAVESGSMQPHMERGDLVFVMEEHRFSSSQAINDTE
ncbi:S26 family signal peptidase [Halocalculus aciditolerans]|uniref:S26 family signal peptidase n=1 Tax=Halocalculus aciditolerans TaxID=1383812 RepID=UPI001E499172|nr:S26 family signal peptidase [Halocalculus aciditolerans]